MKKSVTIKRLYKLKKGNTLFIDRVEQKVLKKRKTDIKSHRKLKEILIFLTNNRMIAVDINGYSVYSIINFGFLVIQWRIWKTPNITFPKG